MLFREDYIKSLIDTFKNKFLPELSNHSDNIVSILNKVHIKLNNNSLPIEFKLYSLFDALWIYGENVNVKLPSNSNHDKDFQEFCFQLMEPWPDKAFNSSGLRIQLMHKSNSKEKHIYKISHI